LGFINQLAGDAFSGFGLTKKSSKVQMRYVYSGKADYARRLDVLLV